MELWHLQVIETTAAFVLYFIIRTTFRVFVRRAARKYKYQVTRISLIKRMLEIFLWIVMGAFILFVWGVDQSELLFFFTSLLTVLGIAFFAQWSILSNITSSFIIFFYHPIRVGDEISVLDKEFEISGRVIDIGLFFLIIQTEEDDRVTIPSNLFMQKMVKKCSSAPPKAKKS